MPAPHCPSDTQIAAAARALRTPGAALMVDHRALYGGLSLLAAKIARTAGCRLIAPYFISRLRRGEGAVRMDRLAYRVEDNLKILAGVTTLVLCGTTRPAGFFAYPGKPGLPENPDGRVIDLCGPDEDYERTLTLLAAQLGVSDADLPADAFQPLACPDLPSGPMRLDRIAQAIAALLPR